MSPDWVVITDREKKKWERANEGDTQRERVSEEYFSKKKKKEKKGVAVEIKKII